MHDNSNSNIVQYVDDILHAALQQGASDIHFEPYQDMIRTRFRIDGLLVEHKQTSNDIANNVSARLKVMSKLDIAERRTPQDGRFQIIGKANKPVNFRMSTCPTMHGEKIVLRILKSTNDFINLAQLGLSESQQKLFVNAIHKTQGLVLVTGPTGSGKTSTLYSALALLNIIEKNISTVEDPIEIQLPGINQVQMNAKTSMTFANTIRTFLRQDPDIIMVGEIRDFETADAAIKASLTGHLVLSTLHTNSAAQTLTRLTNMGIPRYNLTSSISMIVAQRLLRKLCEHCKTSVTVDHNMLGHEDLPDTGRSDITIFRANGCEHCHQGYRGRVGAFEVQTIDEDTQKKLLRSTDNNMMSENACFNGVISLKQSALALVKSGTTSLSEFYRVITG